ncbi:hypothetical protein GOEFS_069_00250 [Gordonia effusa NBRC 100432]|uniref:Uncharacterized protein n=1 Tax=Gordonia effusa NBRC 100432 TaxID=1077974 RepID=H0R1E8_9ACTN|nr:hypothetical protein GOEFS_069_00250 [Gordonia effusa NBRC 100432]
MVLGYVVVVEPIHMFASQEIARRELITGSGGRVRVHDGIDQQLMAGHYLVAPNLLAHNGCQVTPGAIAGDTNSVRR